MRWKDKVTAHYYFNQKEYLAVVSRKGERISSWPGDLEITYFVREHNGFDKHDSWLIVNMDCPCDWVKREKYKV